MIQIVDGGGPFAPTLTYEVSLQTLHSWQHAPVITRRAHKELGEYIDYQQLLSLYEWLKTLPEINVFDLSRDDFPEGHPYPVMFLSGDSSYRISFFTRGGGGIGVKVQEGEREDLFLANQLENRFRNNSIDHPLVKKAFEWLEKGFPNVWDHLLE